MTSLRGLYVITPDNAEEPSALADQIAQVIAGGAKLIQYRNKGQDDRLRHDQATAILRICRPAGVPLIVNDDITLAEDLGADGVHLGRNDSDPIEARQRLGAGAIIGVSCYNDLARAQVAERHGASYVAFGSFFPSVTKPLAVRPSPDLLASASRSLRIPIVAIGGITPQNGGLLIAAGARMLAVVTGIFAQPDLVAAARAYASLFVDGDPR